MQIGHIINQNEPHFATSFPSLDTRCSQSKHQSELEKDWDKTSTDLLRWMCLCDQNYNCYSLDPTLYDFWKL